MSTTPTALRLLGLVLALAAAAGPTVAQERPRGADMAERFSGTLRLGHEAGAAEADLALQKWIVAAGARVELPRVERGFIRVELMAGHLETLAGDQRVRRVEGERWTIGPGQRMAVQTGEDSAVFSLTLVRER